MGEYNLVMKGQVFSLDVYQYSILFLSSWGLFINHILELILDISITILDQYIKITLANSWINFKLRFDKLDLDQLIFTGIFIFGSR